MKKLSFKKNGGINSSVLWRGRSELTGEPIVLIAIVNSNNTKTGAMLQTYILRDDIAPVEANRKGLDRAICGDCPLKGTPDLEKETGTARNRPCYVVLGQGPTVVYKTFDRGGYPVLVDTYGPAYRDYSTADLLAAYGTDQNIRCGTYGDPAAVPAWVWNALLSRAANWTGYTHQTGAIMASNTPDQLTGFCMVSADSLETAQNAWSNGLRTFRVVSDTADIVQGVEVICPATKEGGQKTTCINCNLCSGSASNGRSVAVVAHGAGAKHISAVNI